MPTNDGYDGFEVLAERANDWLKQQKEDLFITNMQSVMVQKDEGAHLDLGKSCFFSMPGINNFEPIEFFRILRIYILKMKSTSNHKKLNKKLLNDTTTPTTILNSTSIATNMANNKKDNKLSPTDSYKFKPANKDDDENACDVTNKFFPLCYPFVYETFTPELMRVVQDGTESNSAITTPSSILALSSKHHQQQNLLQSPQHLTERLEEMKETFSKVIAFLRNSGADVLGAETVLNPMQLYSDGMGQDDEMKFLFTIRLYLTGQISQLMNGNTQAIKRVNSSNNLNNSPNNAGSLLSVHVDKKHHRSSPLFLRSVVSRQFKYRWLVLAISAFTCMSIIVVVSVIYSNKFW